MDSKRLTKNQKAMLAMAVNEGPLYPLAHSTDKRTLESLKSKGLVFVNDKGWYAVTHIGRNLYHTTR